MKVPLKRQYVSYVGMFHRFKSNYSLIVIKYPQKKLNVWCNVWKT